MQPPPNSVRGYSEFFKSGFRALTRRQASSSSSHNYLSGSPDPMLNASSLTPKSNSSGATKGRPRPVSMIVQNTPREKARRRRSSILSFASQLFDHKSATSTTPSDEKSTTSSTRSRPISPLFDSGDSLPEVWITAGGPFTQSARNGSSDEAVVHRFIDPFCSSPDAKSTFIDLSQDDFASSDTLPKRDSFLSFTSSSNRSSIIITRRELPSTLQYHHHPLGQEISDSFWAVEEESDLMLSSEVDHEDWDAPAEIDWRQFHFDIITDDNVDC